MQPLPLTNAARQQEQRPGVHGGTGLLAARDRGGACGQASMRSVRSIQGGRSGGAMQQLVEELVIHVDVRRA